MKIELLVSKDSCCNSFVLPDLVVSVLRNNYLRLNLCIEMIWRANSCSHY